MSKPAEKLTQRQRAVFDFIRERVQQEGRPPTVREIGSRFSFSSTGSVRTHLRALEKKGYIRKQAAISRGIVLEQAARAAADIQPPIAPITRKGWTTREVPVVGRVAAGPPILAVEDIEEILELDEDILPSRGELFALRVSGDSMVNAGIKNGDLVFVRRQPTAEPGDIVVAIVNGEATVKSYQPEGGTICLKPANENFTPIYVDAKTGDFSIVGKVTGMMRRF